MPSEKDKALQVNSDAGVAHVMAILRLVRLA